MSDKINKSDEEWREQLTEEQYHVTRKHGTERAFSGRLDKHMTLAPIFVSAVQHRYFHPRLNLTQDRVGQAFLRRLTMQISAKRLMKAFLCAAPSFIVTVVTRILAMCFLMGRNPPAFAIASIRRHWIL